MSSSYCYCINTMLLLLLLLLDPITNNSFAFAFSPCSNSNVARTTTASTVLEATTTNDRATGGEIDRKNFLVSMLSATATTVAALGGALPEAASAAEPRKRYVLDEDTGDYVEVIEDGDWQKEWKSRYEQMQTMSKDEIFEAARGAGNIELKDLANESPASKKRRAFSGCRDKGIRAKLGNINEKSCSKRVLEGEVDFVLNLL